MSERKDIKQMIKERIFPITILVFQVIMVIVHGETGVYPNKAATNPLLDYSDQMLLYTLTAILAVLGYGILLSYSDRTTLNGLVTTLITVGITVQLCPLILQFWHSVFNGFNSGAQVSLSSQRISMALCISLLLSFTSLVNRLGRAQTFIIIFLYNMGWTFAFEATRYIQLTKSPSSLQIYDDYGTNYIYVFATFFAMITSLILNRNRTKIDPSGPKHSLSVSLIGTGFIFASFPFTGIIYPSSAASNIFRRNEGPMNIYFALTASVICTYISSAIFGKLMIGVRQSIVGVLSGGVSIGIIAGITNNIGAAIAIGAFSGLLSGFWLQIVHPRINHSQTYDHLGIFGPILACSILGAIVIAPALYSAYNNLSINQSGLGGTINDSAYIGYQFVYFAVSAGTASVVGLICGLLCSLFKQEGNNLSFNRLVSKDLGLFSSEYDSKSASQNYQTNANLNNNSI